MRINTKVRYAIRMMADIARRRSDEPVALKEIAARQHLPKMYLSQLAPSLKKAALLKSVWGNKGGYVLAKPAKDITLLEIMEAADGPVSVLDCVLDSRYCDRSDYCECIGIWREINEVIVRTLERYTLADLVEKGRLTLSKKDNLCRTDPEPERSIDGHHQWEEHPVGTR